MSTQSDILAELLSPVSRTQFLRDHYLKNPFALRQGGEPFLLLGQWSKVEQLLHNPKADVIVGQGGTRYSGETPRTQSEAVLVLDEGFTIGVRHADQVDDDLEKLAERFRESLNAPVDVHLYCTPAGQQGFGWHYDAEEVFVLQTHGSKVWSLRKNTVNPWPLIDAIPVNQKYEREITPAMQCTLNAGDWLYIPGGYWHATSAVSQSISLSVGIQAPTALDYFDSLRTQLAQSILWRQRLPTLLPHSELNGADHPSVELIRQLSETIPLLSENLVTLMSSEYCLQTFLKQASVRKNLWAETHATD